MAQRSHALLLAVALARCSGAPAAACLPGAPGCALAPGRYVPVLAGPLRVVWAPADGRYVNEPTVVRAPDGTWHAFANGAAGVGDPWAETQLLHATAPRLAGPWHDEQDILSTRDPDATERSLHAPFVLREGPPWQILYYDGTRPAGEGLHRAVSDDLFRWTRDAAVLPGGRDPFVLRTEPRGDLLYTVATPMEPDGLHDAVAVFSGRALAGWGAAALALRDPAPCPANCWGFFESPYITAAGGYYFLLTTHTDSMVNYTRTEVYRSADPARFFQGELLITLPAHGAEVVLEDGRMYLTSGGWPSRIGAEHRGLSIAPLAWEAE